MELSLESYRIIVNNVQSRADLVCLCRVSRSFRQVAERALYNTLLIRISTVDSISRTIALCETLEKQPRISSLVDALTILVANDEEVSGDEGANVASEVQAEEQNGESEEQEELAAALAMSLTENVEAGVQEASTSGEGEDEDDDREGEENIVGVQRPDLDHCWTCISLALQKTTNLRHLNIHISSNIETSVAWILTGSTFRLRSYHCDVTWDHRLVAFLNLQDELEDLYIIDYHDLSGLGHSSPLDSPSSSLAISPDSMEAPSSSISPNALRSLHVLECTFTEAATTLVPGRPVIRLKTAFSSSILSAKRMEMKALFAATWRSTRRMRSLDIGDSVYTEEFGTEMLQTIVAHSRTRDDLRYLGTLVLPVKGNERLMFYALLR
ncbi:hypothetical protein D9758_016507 [Tetrapyrgos nigripes]|uniref:Uncharacterized protein n=1 Tax=Tetrapyrgos nigripes TaxID=182062 RepID=A0A8H5CL32_9AGAR|nr:hypothetical protein D9758_016507 [Tetrapyrgos nigripes]